MSTKFEWTKRREQDIRELTAGAFVAKYRVSKNFTSRARRVRSLAAVRGTRIVCPHAAVVILGTQIDQEIAERFGVNRTTVEIWRLERGIPSFDACSRDRLDAELRQAVELGTTQRVVAELTGWPSPRVRARSKELGLTVRRGREKRDAPTLRVQAMAMLRACGWHLEEIGGAFGVQKQSVLMALDRWGLGRDQDA